MGAELDALVESYRALRAGNPGQLELVKLEHRIWDQVKLDEGKGVTKAIMAGERRDWFFTRFGGNVSSYEHRASIYNAGTWAHRLFTLIDQGSIKHSFAAMAVRRAKQLARERQIPAEDALAITLQEMTSGSAPEAEESLKPSEDVEIPQDLIDSFDHGATANSKLLYRRIMALAGAYLESAFKGRHINEYFKRKLSDDFSDSLELLIQQFRKDVSTVKRDTRDDGIKEIGAARFAWACEVLGLNYRFGQVVDMRLIKSRKNRRALDLHPDRNRTNPKAHEEMENVLEAFAILATYHEKNNRRAPDGSSGKNS